MQKHVEDDSWSSLPSEDLTIGGIDVCVRGLNIRELREVTKPCKGDPEAIAEALVAACVTRSDGKDVTPATMRPDVFKVLSDAVARVNGFNAGNSNATGADDSSTG